MKNNMFLALFVIALVGTSVVLAANTINTIWRPTPMYKRLCSMVDLSDDGEVNIIDLGILLANYGREGCWITNKWCDGNDLNLDGRVNGSDLDILRAWYGMNCYTKKYVTEAGGDDVSSAVDHYVKVGVKKAVPTVAPGSPNLKVGVYASRNKVTATE